MAKASDNPYPSALFVEQASDPATPAASHWRLFFKAGGLYAIDDAGAVVGPFSVGGVESVVAGTNITVDNTDPANPVISSTASGGGGGVTQLAVAEATTSAAYVNSTTTDADVDATNLAVTFTVPASGEVWVETMGLIDPGSNVFEWTIREGTTTVKTRTMGGGYDFHRAVHRITGLTAGASKTYKWGFKRLGGAGSITIYTGGNAGTNGNAIMRVFDMG